MIKTITLDVLDCNLNKEYDGFINNTPEIRFSIYQEKLLLDSNYWDKYSELLKPYNFDWVEFKYEDVAQAKVKIDSIITENFTGVYLFVLKNENQIYDLHKYVLYVGIAGEDDSRRPLKERLNDYFYIEGIKKRDKVHMMLKKYYHNMYVAFSYLDVTPIELQTVEEYLHGFFYPIYCERDFPTELKVLRKSFAR